MNQTLHLSSREMALLLSILSDKSKTDVEIEKTPSEFRVHYKSNGGSGSQAAVYSLAGSMLESAAKIRELEKKLA
jgi:hypothetical protein